MWAVQSDRIDVGFLKDLETISIGATCWNDAPGPLVPFDALHEGLQSPTIEQKKQWGFVSYRLGLDGLIRSATILQLPTTQDYSSSNMFESHNLKANRHVATSASGDLQYKRHTLHKTPSSSVEIHEHAPGEFDLRMSKDLCAWVLSGEAEVNLADGRELKLRPGNTFFLPREMNGHWRVTESLRTAVVTNCPPAPPRPKDR